MEKWQNFFLQRMGTDEEGQPYPVCESVNEWGIFCKKIPFKIFDKVKEPASRSWNDEDGDDEDRTHWEIAEVAQIEGFTPQRTR